jgi:nucleotidyltransferase/DNA polymerase involved in DNA repair
MNESNGIRIMTTHIPPKKTYREKALQELRSIPGVGKSISIDLWNLNIHSVAALKDKNPEELYRKHCILAGQPVDRCLLYVFRCAVYYASRKRHHPELLLWWNWKDR